MHGLRGLFLLVLVFCLAGVSQSSGQGPGDETNEASPDKAGIRTIYLIRHGQYDSTDRRDATVGRGLVPLGITQSRLIAARLRGMPIEWSSFRTSTLTRARETAFVIGQEFPDLPLESTPLLSECMPPTRREDVARQRSAEDTQACEERLQQAFDTLFVPSTNGDRNDLVVAHGNVIRYFATRVLEVDPTAWLGMAIGNCSLTVVKILPDERRILLSFSDVGHLPPNLQTWTDPGPTTTLSIVPGVPEQ